MLGACVDVGAGDKVGTWLTEGIGVDSATRIIGCGSDVNTPPTPKAINTTANKKINPIILRTLKENGQNSSENIKSQAND